MAHSLILTPNVPSGAVSQELVGGLDGTGIWLASGPDALNLPPPSYDEAYAASSDTEGGKRSRSTPQNVKGGLKVNIGARDAATYNTNVGNWQKTVEAVRRWGGTLVYTPDGGTAVTYDLESMYITEMPQDGVLIFERLAESAAEFIALPYGRLATITNATLSDIDSFWRDSITNQEWRFDAGGGTLSVSGGLLVPSSTAEKRLVRALNVIDVSQAVVKVTTGASVASGDTGITLKRLDASNEIRCHVGFGGAASFLRIAKYDATVSTNLATTGAFTTAAATSYWLQATMAGNVITVKLFSQDPNTTTSPTQVGTTLSFTLITGDATKFGSGVKGSPGLRFNPQATDYRWDDFRVDSGSIEGFDPVLNFELLSIPGSAPAQAKLRLTDMSAQARNFAEWGLDDRYYEKTAPQPTLLDSDVLSTTGLAGAQTTRAGSYDPGAAGNSIIQATLASVPLGVCSTGTQSHTGPQRIRARVFGSGTGPMYVRFAYRVADAPWSRTSWVKAPILGAFYDLTLGSIRIPKALLGSQSWEGRIEAYSATPGDTLGVDYIRVMPAKRYGKVRAPSLLSVVQVFSARDEFTQAAAALNGLTATVGGNWATSGVATDFATTGTPNFQVTRTGAAAEASFRRAVLAASLGTDAAVQADFTVPTFNGVPTVQWKLRLLARAPASGDTSDCVAELTFLGSNGNPTLAILNQAATVYSASVPQLLYTGYALTFTALFIVVGASQQWTFYVGSSASTLLPVASGSLLGALPVSGNVGFAMRNVAAGSTPIIVDNFKAWAPEVNPPILSGGNIEIRHNAVLRSTGARLSPEGAYLKIDPSGRDGRGAQLAVASRRSDIDTLPDDQIADAVKAEVDLTPRVVLLDG